MASETKGLKNEPIYDPNGPPADAADLTEVAAYAALVGNLKVLTKSQREGLAGKDKWVGLEVYETDTQDIWRNTAGGWVLWFRGWTDYTPTRTNFTASVTLARYRVIRGSVRVRLELAVSVMGTNPTVSLPVTAADALLEHLPGAALIPGAGSEVVAVARKSADNQVAFYYLFIGGTTVYINNISAGVPFAWGATGRIAATFEYQAA